MTIQLQVADSLLRRYGVGIDCHSQFIEICVMVPDHVASITRKFAATYNNVPVLLEQALEWVFRCLAECHVHVNPGDLVYVLESTATYHMPTIRVWGNRPIVINPSLAAQFKARKTDKWDAAQMAHQCLAGLFEPSYMPTPETDMLRIILRNRKKQQQAVGRSMTQIALRLTQWACPILCRRLRTKTVRCIFDDLLIGRTPPLELAPEFEHWGNVPKRMHQLFLMMLKDADSGKANMKMLENEAIENLTPENKELFNLLLTVPGVGKITGLVWMAEIEPSNRFSKSRKCVAYAGFDPTPMISAGKTVSSHCRKGNKQLRTVLVQAAQGLLRRKVPFVAKECSLKKPFATKVMAVARRIVNALYWVSMKRIPFQELDFRGSQAIEESPKDGADGGDADQRIE